MKALLIKLRLFYSNSGDNNQCEDGEHDVQSSKESGFENAQTNKDTGKVKCSELLFIEQLISECQKPMQGQSMSQLTFVQYENMDSTQKSKIQNRVRQWALKV